MSCKSNGNYCNICSGLHLRIRRTPTITTQLFACLVFSLVSVNNAFAWEEDKFQYDYSYSYQQTDIDPDEKTTLHLAGFDYYFLPVESSNEPLAEVAFLQQIGSFSLAYGLGKDKLPGGDIDAHTFLIDYLYTMPYTPIMVDVGFTRFDTSETTSNLEGTANTFQLQAGSYIGYGNLVGLSFASTSTTFDLSGIQVADFHTKDYGAFIKSVDKLGNHYVNMEASATLRDVDDSTVSAKNKILALNGDYYLTNAASFGVGYTLNQGDDTSSEGSEYNVKLDYFVNERFDITFNYSQFSADNSIGADDESYILTLTLRD